MQSLQVAAVCDVPSTRFLAPFTHVIFSHGSSKDSDHVVLSFDIVIN